MFNIKFVLKNKSNAFSLVEVLMTLLILSLVMVLMAPMITKRVVPRKTEGIVYTYKSDKQISSGNVCFARKTDGTFEVTNNCSEYVFTPPPGINIVNLTLVAGGGGGGGAAGGLSEIGLNQTASANYVSDKLKDVTINYIAAKGSDGGAINTDCYDTTAGTICAGKGGKSSAAIFNFKVPENLFRQTPNIIAPTSTSSITAAAQSASVAYSSLVMPNITYAVYPSAGSNASYAACKIGTGSFQKQGDAGFSSCLIPSQNIIAPKDGTPGYYLLKNLITPQHSNKTLLGGLGGSTGTLSGGYGAYGAGGTGANAVLSACVEKASCTVTAGTAGAGASGYVSYNYTVEHPGGVGGGGAGGTAVKIIGVALDGSKTYVIRVGKGGAGGNSGISGTSATAGSAGTGGVTTSIWERSSSGSTTTETLLYMVAGGAPGTGGAVRTGTNEKGNNGASSRNYPLLISSSSTRLSNVAIDTTMATKGSAESVSLTGVSNAAAIRLKYPFLNNEPYKTINKGGKNVSSIDDKIGGFSNYLTDNSLNYITVSSTGNTTESVYDGFYYRTVIGNSVGYPGGLGGFSGLGTKGGCGGAFLANSLGRTKTSVANSDGSVTNTTKNSGEYVNKFMVLNKSYDVNNYYDNCSYSTPNGQSAVFILPDANTSALGSAGAGGGGGGYTAFVAPGKGGAGQDGYLMINWRR